MIGEIPLASDLVPTISFKRPKYRYGYQGPSWLPSLYCDNKGLKNLALTYYKVLEIPRPKKVQFISEIDKLLKGPPVGRWILNSYLSDLLAGEYSGPFRKRIKERVEMVKKIGPEEYNKMLDNRIVKRSKTNLLGF
jgi:hypothetical protein